MGIVFLFHGSTLTLRSGNNFAGKPIHHCFFASSSGIGNHPFYSQGNFSFGPDFHGDLECSTTNPTTLHLYSRSNIVKRFFPNLKTVLTYFVFHLCDRIIEDLVSNTLLPVLHQTIDEFGDQSIIKPWIRKNIPLFWF